MPWWIHVTKAATCVAAFVVSGASPRRPPRRPPRCRYPMPRKGMPRATGRSCPPNGSLQKSDRRKKFGNRPATSLPPPLPTKGSASDTNAILRNPQPQRRATRFRSPSARPRRRLRKRTRYAAYRTERPTDVPNAPLPRRLDGQQTPHGRNALRQSPSPGQVRPGNGQPKQTGGLPAAVAPPAPFPVACLTSVL